MTRNDLKCHLNLSDIRATGHKYKLQHVRWIVRASLYRKLSSYNLITFKISLKNNRLDCVLTVQRFVATTAYLNTFRYATSYDWKSRFFSADLLLRLYVVQMFGVEKTLDGFPAQLNYCKFSQWWLQPLKFWCLMFLLFSFGVFSMYFIFKISFRLCVRNVCETVVVS